MAATGYLFALFITPQRRGDGKRNEQGMIQEILGQNVIQPVPTPEEPYPVRLPPIPSTRSSLASIYKLHRTEQALDYAWFFVRGMKVEQFSKFYSRLIGLRLSRADLLALMGDEADRHLVRKAFRTDQRLGSGDWIAVTFANVRAMLRNNDNDDRVILED